MYHKSQITAFLIVGLIILVTFGLIIMIQQPDVDPSSDALVRTQLSGSALAVQQYVDSCLLSTVNGGLHTLGVQGGYYHLPDTVLSTTAADVPYYSNSGTAGNRQTPEGFLSELDAYLTDIFPSCISDFFPLDGVNITAGTPVISSTFTAETVSISLDYPLTINADGMVQTISAFNIERPLRLNAVYSAVDDILTNRNESPNSIDFFINPSNYFTNMKKTIL